MEHRFFNHSGSRFSYYVVGNGSRTMICLHGYGEDASSFRVLEKVLVPDSTFYLIELPFHGKTEWNEASDLLPEDLKAIIEQIIPAPGPVTLIGYSLGGRIILSLFELMHDRVDELLLIAPDGLKVNPWYWLATQNAAGNRLFKLTMDHPKWFFIFLKGLNKVKLVNSSIFKFVNYYIGDVQVRNDLYNRWTRLRKFRPNLKKIKHLIRKEGTKVTLVYGAHDKIILPSRGIKFRKGIEDLCGITILDSGHRLLESRHAPEIFRTLNERK